MSSFTWIGAITKDIGLCISWGPMPFKTIDDVKTQQMVVAGTGAGSETDTWPIVLNEVIDPFGETPRATSTRSVPVKPR
jgi:hypothetical protein